MNDKIALGIAVAGLCLSLWNFFEALISKKRRLSYSITPVYYCVGTLCVKITFRNYSTVPVLVTSVFADVDGVRRDFGLKRDRIFEYLYPERRGKVAEDTRILPLTIEPMHSESVLLSASCSNSIPHKVVFSVMTSRGKLIDQNAARITDDVQELLQYLE